MEKQNQLMPVNKVNSAVKFFILTASLAGSSATFCGSNSIQKR